MFSFILILGVSLLAAITVHEAAHAWAANYLGDPTAKLMGRLSLNPLVHLDPVGTLVFIVSAFAGLPFGWGKPVQFDPYNLKDPKKDAALISIAGPVSNIIFASILSLVYRFLPFGLFQELIIVNIVLAIFNLIPIHPLDGEKVLVALLPNREARQFDLFMSRYGFVILLVLIFPIFGGTSIVSTITSPIVSFLLRIFLP
jgi:Zn-dependent protease